MKYFSQLDHIELPKIEVMEDNSEHWVSTINPVSFRPVSTTSSHTTALNQVAAPQPNPLRFTDDRNPEN